uniref:Clp R domain-containing protein n=1 Tax=Oryza brachyantha TaxID=4533 RepID=J3LDK5_ORYBR
MCCKEHESLSGALHSGAMAMAAVNQQSAKARCDRGGSGSTSPCLSLLDAAGAACCGDCAAAKALPQSVLPPPTTTSIPPWMQHLHCRDPQETAHMKKWMSAHGGSPSRRTALNISTVVSPCSSVSSYEQYYPLHQPYQPWLVADDDDAQEAKQHPWKSRCRGDVVAVGGADDGGKLLLLPAVKVKSHDSSASNGSVEVECRSRFKEVSAENLKVLCGALEKEVPWQKEIVPEIASTVLRCRSGMAKRSRVNDASSKTSASSKEHTWMLFLGGDMDGKVRVARELASLVFGSPKSFVSIGAASSSPARSDNSTEQLHRSKRPRPETTTSGRDNDHLEALYDAVRDNPRRVILIEHVDKADRRCQTGIREAIESGVVRSRRDGGEDAVLGDAIVVLSCESLSSSSTTASSPPAMIKKAKTDSSTSGEELNVDDDHQRKAAASSSSSCFDLNMSVEDDEAAEERCSGEEAGKLLLKAVDRVLVFRSIEEL